MEVVCSHTSSFRPFQSSVCVCTPLHFDGCWTKGKLCFDTRKERNWMWSGNRQLGKFIGGSTWL